MQRLTILFKKFLLIIAIACVSFSTVAQSIDNGSLTGPVANAAVPSGWSSLLESPDTNDENNAAGLALDPATIIWGVTPSGPSPDGGTWVGFAASDVGPFQESFGQTVTGLTIGVEYEISWYAANFGAILNNGTDEYLQVNEVDVLIDGTSTGTGGPLPVSPDWVSQSLTFVATAVSHEIAFQPSTLVKSYLQIDGIALSLSSAPPVTPPPAPPPPAEPIPTLAEWALITLVLMLVFFGLVAIRRTQ